MTYNDTNLRRLFDALSPKERRKALTAAFRREARKVRRVAVQNLRAGVRSNSGLERGIRASVFRRAAGFKVTIGSKKECTRRGRTRSVWTGMSFHRNRRGLEKPVLIWLEAGTARRSTVTAYWKPKARFRADGRWRMTGNDRGAVRAVRFMERTADQCRSSVTDSLHGEIVSQLEKLAQRYGCN